jgi:hypothetical protein
LGVLDIIQLPRNLTLFLIWQYSINNFESQVLNAILKQPKATAKFKLDIALSKFKILLFYSKIGLSFNIYNLNRLKNTLK